MSTPYQLAKFDRKQFWGLSHPAGVQRCCCDSMPIGSTMHHIADGLDTMFDLYLAIGTHMHSLCHPLPLQTKLSPTASQVGNFMDLQLAKSCFHIFLTQSILNTQILKQCLSVPNLSTEIWRNLRRMKNDRKGNLPRKVWGMIATGGSVRRWLCQVSDFLLDSRSLCIRCV